jgi:hypothetical protein
MAADSRSQFAYLHLKYFLTAECSGISFRQRRLTRRIKLQVDDIYASCDYSYLSATIGSTRIARRAGM